MSKPNVVPAELSFAVSDKAREVLAGEVKPEHLAMFSEIAVFSPMKAVDGAKLVRRGKATLSACLFPGFSEAIELSTDADSLKANLKAFASIAMVSTRMTPGGTLYPLGDGGADLREKHPDRWDAYNAITTYKSRIQSGVMTWANVGVVKGRITSGEATTLGALSRRKAKEAPTPSATPEQEPDTSATGRNAPRLRIAPKDEAGEDVEPSTAWTQANVACAVAMEALSAELLKVFPDDVMPEDLTRAIMTDMMVRVGGWAEGVGSNREEDVA